MLADFRGWLEQLAAGPRAGAPAGAAQPAVDLHTLVGQFVALRHEVNLQTKATRAQQEQNSQTLAQLSQAVAALEQPDEAEADETEADAEPSDESELVRPLLKSLIEMHDALTLAARELERLQDNVLARLGAVGAPAGSANGTGSDPLLQPLKRFRPAFWERWLAPGHSAVLERLFQHFQHRVAQERQQFGHDLQSRDQAVQEAVGQARNSLDSVRTGFAMSLQRVERALAQHGLEPIPSVGQPLDPETMEVVEATLDRSRPSGEVIEEVRRGYLWHGRVFRFAQVRVAKS